MIVLLLVGLALLSIWWLPTIVDRYQTWKFMKDWERNLREIEQRRKEFLDKLK